MTPSAIEHEPRQPARTIATPRRRFGRAWPLAIVATLVLLASGSQLALPGLAADRIKSSLAGHAEGVTVSVTALPAIALLFDHADSVTVRIKRLFPGGRGSLVALLDRVSHADSLDATVGELETAGLRLQNISLRKRGTQLSLAGSVTRAAITRALPVRVQLTQPADRNNALAVSISATVFGRHLKATGTLRVHSGALQLSPGPPLDLVHLTVFSDPRVSVDSVTMQAHGERYSFTVRGHYT